MNFCVGVFVFLITTMAIAIKNIPALKGKAAKEFLTAAEKSTKRKASIDFSEKVRIAQQILQKSRV